MVVNFEKSVDIKATPEQVRAVFLDFPKLGEWNDVVKSITVISNHKEPVPGATLECKISNMNFKPIVVKNDETEFSWKGKLLSDSIFCGVHYFRFEKLDDNSTRFYHGEDFEGWLFGPYRWVTGDKKINEIYESLAVGLKKRVEELYP